MGSKETDRQFQEWRDAIKAIPARLLGPVQRRVDGSDLAQNAVLQLWLQGSSPEDVNRAYLTQVARGHAWKIRRFHNQARRAVDREVRLTKEPTTTATPESVAQHREELSWVSDRVKKLPEDQQRIIHAHLHRKMTFAAIAEELDLSERACRYRYHMAIESIRKAAQSEME